MAEGSQFGHIEDPGLAANGFSWDGALATLQVAHQFFTWTRTVSNHSAGGRSFDYPRDLPGLAEWSEPKVCWGPVVHAGTRMQGAVIETGLSTATYEQCSGLCALRQDCQNFTYQCPTAVVGTPVKGEQSDDGTSSCDLPSACVAGVASTLGWLTEHRSLGCEVITTL